MTWWPGSVLPSPSRKHIFCAMWQPSAPRRCWGRGGGTITRGAARGRARSPVVRVFGKAFGVPSWGATAIGAAPGGEEKRVWAWNIGGGSVGSFPNTRAFTVRGVWCLPSGGWFDRRSGCGSAPQPPPPRILSPEGVGWGQGSTQGSFSEGGGMFV